MARFSPALARTFRPGACAVPFADADILRTGNASTTTAPWCACLVEKILARVRYPLVQTRHAADCLAPVAAAALLVRQAALRPAERPQCFLAVVGRGNNGTIAQRGKRRNTQVDANCGKRRRRRSDDFPLPLDSRKPLTGPVRDRDVADFARHLAPVALTQPYPAELWKLDAPG